jgi:hypothetical protein
MTKKFLTFTFALALMLGTAVTVQAGDGGGKKDKKKCETKTSCCQKTQGSASATSVNGGTAAPAEKAGCCASKTAGANKTECTKKTDSPK